LFFFFFQAEDGIRDIGVTGVRRVLFRSVHSSTLPIFLKCKYSFFFHTHKHDLKLNSRYIFILLSKKINSVLLYLTSEQV